ncbi:hypothetical protein ACFL6N_02870 [Thermodesulfobacteriota bacterium]
MNNIWRKIPPEDLYRRLTGPADREAWDHLTAIVYLLLKKHFFDLNVTKIEIDDQLQTTLLHILTKIKNGTLTIDDPRRFYGFLRLLVYNLLIDTLRPRNPIDYKVAIVDIEGFLRGKKHSPQKTAEANDLIQVIWNILLNEADLDDYQREIIKEDWLMKKGASGLKSFQEVTDRVNEILNLSLTYKQAAAKLNTGLARLKMLSKKVFHK